MGASEAVSIPATDVVVDERVRLKCLVPLCSSYGRNLMCPPNVIQVSDFKNIIKRYHAAILVKLDAKLSKPPEELTLNNNLPEAWEIAKSARNNKKQPSTPITDYFCTLRDTQNRLNEIIIQLESLCIAEGYTFAAGLGAGICFLCEECVGTQSGLPCRHPFKARPSMEALGIDVVTTVKKSGMQVNFTLNETRSWVGLILVD